MMLRSLPVVAFAVLYLSCGGDDSSAVCGNMVVEAGEGCDDGNMINDDNCTNFCQLNLPDTLDARIKWAFNRDAAPLFDADSCFDLGVSRVLVEIEHTTSNEVLMGEETCGFRQVTFIDIAAGDWLARIRPVNTDGDLMTTEVIQQLFTISTADVEVELNVPYDKWKNDYAGTYFFRLHWGQMDIDCTAAAPPVVQHEMTLERGGVAVTQVTGDDHRLDGTAPGDCISLDEQFPQDALLVPWGPYMFHVVGLDSGGVAQFQESYETFVGAGLSNPEMHFVVRSLNEPDAGAPDAGGPDGG